MLDNCSFYKYGLLSFIYSVRVAPNRDGPSLVSFIQCLYPYVSLIIEEWIPANTPWDLAGKGRGGVGDSWNKYS